MENETKNYLDLQNFLKRKAFTLIEILLVIGIIAILALALVIAINPGERLAKARDTIRERHIHSLKQAILSYKVKEGNFPNDLEGILGGEICNLQSTEKENCDEFVVLSDILPNYLSFLPINPGTEEISKGTGYAVAVVGNRVAVWPLESETRRIGTRPALEFDGSHDYLRLSSYGGLRGLSEVTISYWVRHTGTSGRQYHLWANGNVLIEGADIFQGSGWPDFRVRWNLEGSWRNSHLVEEAFVLGELTHIVISFDHGTTKIYFNGKEVYHGEDSQVSISDTSPHYDFGRRGVGDGMEGTISEIRIYDKALSQQEIENLFKGRNIENNPFFYWPLTEGEDCVLYDHSGNENHGTMEPDCEGENSPNWVIEK